MQGIVVLQRELSSSEFKRMKAGFDQHAIDNLVKIQGADRFTFIAKKEKIFVGCSSALAYKNDNVFSGWAYLTDLFVEKPYRHEGIGAELLKRMEQHIQKLGIHHIWTWTAGYEAPNFYKKQGYKVFAELEKWYSDGSSRIALRKNLSL